MLNTYYKLMQKYYLILYNGALSDDLKDRLWNKVEYYEGKKK
jgi:hypothetical protein